MDEQKRGPFGLDRGRLLLLVLGAVIVAIAISTWLGGINDYQALREANTAVKNETTPPAN